MEMYWHIGTEPLTCQDHISKLLASFFRDIIFHLYFMGKNDLTRAWQTGEIDEDFEGGTQVGVRTSKGGGKKTGPGAGNTIMRYLPQALQALGVEGVVTTQAVEALGLPQGCEGLNVHDVAERILQQEKDVRGEIIGKLQQKAKEPRESNV